VAGIGRARREALGDAAAKARVRVDLARRDVDRRDRDERPERAGVVGRAGDVDRRRLPGRREGDDRDVDVSDGIDLRVDVRRPGTDFGGRGDGDRLVEGLATVAGDSHSHLDAAAVAVEDRPRRVDVILEPVADDVVDGDPLLVLDMAELLGGRVVRRLERHAAVALHPVATQVVAVRDVDLAVRVQLRRVEERVERQHRLVDAALRVEVDVRVGRVRPARRHLLRPGRDAIVALQLVVADRRAAQDLVRAEIEHVEGRVLVEEELRRTDQVLSSRFDRQPRLGVIGVERPGTARSRLGDARARRHRVAAASRRTARHLVREGDA
jgi:hypothetical protein